MLAPEDIQLQLLVEQAGQPTSAPLPGPAQFQFIQPNADDPLVLDVRSPVLRKQSYRLRLRRARLEYFDGFAPGCLLAGVNFPQVEHVPLHHLAPMRTIRSSSTCGARSCGNKATV